MFKRRKDGGFTLIELMIVIAIIGILAVVLVPKMSGAKDSAKATGAIANAKSVEAYVLANIDRWGTSGTTARNYLTAQFVGTTSGGTTTPAKEELENPISSSNAVVVDKTPTAAKGAVIVTVPDTLGEITITAYGNGIASEDVVYEKKITRN